MDSVVFLSGITRGATLEGIARSLAAGFQAAGLSFVEISLLDNAGFLKAVRGLDFQSVRFVFSWVSMGMEMAMSRPDGTTFNPWQEMGVPFISLHGDSPAYFFDRHVVRDSRFISLYGFTEHAELRKRLPLVRGPVETLWPSELDVIPLAELDFEAKKNSTLIFLKNGKDPAYHRRLWPAILEPKLLRMLQELAARLESDLDNPAANQIDDVVTRYFEEKGFDVEHLVKLRLFFIAQLDDYLRAVKSSAMVKALMRFPVEIRGNNWDYLDFAGCKAKLVDSCDYVESISLIRGALGIIDMSPNTSSRPHDRVMRAYGAHTACLTNEQDFLSTLPHQDRLSFRFEKESLEDRVAGLLAHPADTLEMGTAVAQAYRTLHPPQEMIETMLDCVSLVRFDRLSQRPAGMQDFFAWPPHVLAADR